jgi:hypothetical protein
MGEPMGFRPTFIANTGASELTRRTNRKVSSPDPQQDTMPPHNRHSRLCITQCSVLQAHVAPQLSNSPRRDPPDVRAHAGFVPDGVCMDAGRTVERTASPPPCAARRNR